MQRFRAAILLGAVLLVSMGFARRASAQAPGWRLIADNGYQFLVPATWTKLPVPQVGGIIVDSMNGSGIAYVLVLPAPFPLGTPAQISSLTLSALLAPTGTETSYTVVSAAAPTQVPGADAAANGQGNYLDSTNAVLTNEYEIAAIRGSGLYALLIDVPASYDRQYPYLAQAILNSFQVTGPGSASPVSSSSASTGATLLQVNGSGDRQTASFPVTTGQIQVCWNVSGISPGLALGPDVTFFIETDGPVFDSANFGVTTEGRDCSYAHLKPGTYYVKAIATPWTNWSITITTA